MGGRIISGLLWLYILLMVIVWTPIMAIIFAFTAPFDPGRYAAGRWFRLAAVSVVRLNPRWKFRTSGVVLRDPRRPYVVVGNHESYADIFLLSTLPWEMKWMSKAEIFKLPFMGWMMRMAGDIPVHRDSAASRRQAFADARDRLGRKVSVMMMPEGTRSRTLDMLPFKDGAFRVAIEMGCPVVPVAIAGTRHAMAAGSFVFNRATAEARVLEPIDTAGMTVADVPRLRDEVRERIRIARDALRAELGLPGASPAA